MEALVQMWNKLMYRQVECGMDERFRRVEQVEHRVQMLLGIFASHGVLPLEFKPAYSVGELVLHISMRWSRRRKRRAACSNSSQTTSSRSTKLA
jgi:hypothetical protein